MGDGCGKTFSLGTGVGPPVDVVCGDGAVRCAGCVPVISRVGCNACPGKDKKIAALEARLAKLRDLLTNPPVLMPAGDVPPSGTTRLEYRRLHDCTAVYADEFGGRVTPCGQHSPELGCTWFCAEHEAKASAIQSGAALGAKLDEQAICRHDFAPLTISGLDPRFCQKCGLRAGQGPLE